MRRVDFETNLADTKRIALARRFDEFGLDDPLGEARLRGFSLEHYHSGSFGIHFKNRRVALCQVDSRATPYLRVEEVVPQDADAALTTIVTRARDVARRIDSILKADRREIEAFRKTAMLEVAESEPHVLNAFDAFALVSASHKPNQRVVCAFSDYSMDTLTVQFKSQAYPENDMTLQMYFNNGQFSRHETRLNPVFFEALIAEARDFIEPGLRNLPFSEKTVNFSADVIEHWDDVLDVQHEMKDFIIDISDHRISVKRGDVLVIVLEKQYAENEEVGHVRTVKTFHAGLEPSAINGCLEMVKDAILRSPRMTPPDMAGLSEEDIGRMAARELSDVDFGYGM